MKTNKLIWETLDHINEEKSNDWFWIVGIIAVAVAVLAIFFNNILFALLILISAFTAFMMAHTSPKMVDYEINRQGVKIGEILYPYSSLESYYVIDEDGFDRDRLLLKSKKMLMPLIIVPLTGQVDNEDVREYLIEYLDEEEMEESFAQVLMARLGF